MNPLSWSEASITPHERLFEVLNSREEGMSAEGAQKTLKEVGRNESIAKETTWWQVLLHQFTSVFIYLLLAAALIALFMGEYANAILILIFLLINAGLGFVQEYRAEHSLELLKNYVARMTRVRRDGKEISLPAAEVVPGDVILLDAGDMIPADGVFVRAENVTVDESSLTGETIAVPKDSRVAATLPTQFVDAKNIGFARTTLTAGNAELLVFATGAHSQVGAIAEEIERTVSVSAFEIGIKKFSSFILKMVVATIPLIFLLNLIVHHGEVRMGEFLLFIIALTVSAIPEALPLVTTISITRGALRLAKKNVVPRRLSAIEDLGSIQVLCTDKTGTITENKLSVASVHGDVTEVLRMASITPLSAPDTTSIQNSVFDTAILAKAGSDIRNSLGGVLRVDEIPFDPVRKKGSVLVDMPDGTHLLVVRGAPETVIRSNDPKRKQAEEFAMTEGAKGCRVIAIATKKITTKKKRLIETADEESAKLVGLISFVDPLKSSTKAAVRDALLLGVQVKIITGDSREVAAWVGKEARIIKGDDEVITGEELERMSESEQLAAVLRCHVFARTMPLQKFHIIQLLERQKLVGFLGEGFNDAPALKLAHVGLAVSGASDIARDASDIILLNPSLHVIIDGIKEGRSIFANTTKYIRATLTSNFGNFYALAFSSLFIPYLPMLPIQILLLNLLSDFPMIAIATDNVDESELERPKGYQVKEIIAVALVLGAVSTLFDFSVFGIFVGEGEHELQTMWFVASVLTELILLFSIRTRKFFLFDGRPSMLIILLTSSVCLLTVILPFTALGQQLFGFVAPTPRLLAIVFGLVVLYFFSTEAMKLVFYHIWTRKTEEAVSAK
jgi:Mg2+-importing ATPase